MIVIMINNVTFLKVVQMNKRIYLGRNLSLNIVVYWKVLHLKKKWKILIKQSRVKLKK